MKGLKRVTPREWQVGPLRRSHGCGLGVAFACAVERSEKRLQSFKGFKFFKPLKRLRAGKRQAWTPIRSHEGFKACNAWQTAGWTTQKKPLMWPWGVLLDRQEAIDVAVGLLRAGLGVQRPNKRGLWRQTAG